MHGCVCRRGIAERVARVRQDAHTDPVGEARVGILVVDRLDQIAANVVVIELALAEVAVAVRSGTEIVRQIQLGPAGPIARRLLRSRESFLVSPDELARLPIGQVAISIRFAQQRIALVQVDPLRPDGKES